MDLLNTNFRDPRIRSVIDEGYQKRFPPTPPNLTPLNVPETPFLPSFSTSLNPERHVGLINDDEILDPTNMAIKNYKSQHFIVNFYHCFKTYPTEKFTREVHRNATNVLKHVIHQQNEQKDAYKKERDQLRANLNEKDSFIRHLQINDQITRDANEKFLQSEILKLNTQIKEFEDGQKKLSKDYDELHEDYLAINDKMNIIKQNHEEEIVEKDEHIESLENENKRLKEEIKKLKNHSELTEKQSKDELDKVIEERKKKEMEVEMYLRHINEIKHLVNNWPNEGEIIGRKRAMLDNNGTPDDKRQKSGEN